MKVWIWMQKLYRFLNIDCISSFCTLRSSSISPASTMSGHFVFEWFLLIWCRSIIRIRMPAYSKAKMLRDICAILHRNWSAVAKGIRNKGMKAMRFKKSKIYRNDAHFVCCIVQSLFENKREICFYVERPTCKQWKTVWCGDRWSLWR